MRHVKLTFKYAIFYLMILYRSTSLVVTFRLLQVSSNQVQNKNNNIFIRKSLSVGRSQVTTGEIDCVLVSYQSCIWFIGDAAARDLMNTRFNYFFPSFKGNENKRLPLSFYENVLNIIVLIPGDSSCLERPNIC